MAALVIAEHDNVTLDNVTLNTIAALAACDPEVHVLVAGDDCAGVAVQAAAAAGVRRVLLAQAPHFKERLPENLAAQVLALAADYGWLAAAATAVGKSTMPRVAALLDVNQISEITRVIDGNTFERPTYAGNVIETVQSAERIKVLTVRPTGFDAVAASGGLAAVVDIPSVAHVEGSQFVSRVTVKSDRPQLAGAGVVVSGGRGLGSSEQFSQVLEPLADQLGAALGASRAAVDAGFAPNDFQVGQTGKVVAPQLYVAVGISGAIQHLAGMKDSKVIVAINKDPEAPIFQVADYGLVGDLFEAVPQLLQQLQQSA
ncbi:electron transfer flavoprotein subunit alpha/FixB family protein [Herbaspirillum autotrophicum]|uniref:electron transfer flavoprotein subunit alpha/FixB family protein n=1 Tax=Herbaspirillum autotrophicum TaxID=180195 RepID=UPI00067D89F2|nr:FAD-binding protein [Herbaspirillum autotrophicum]